MDYFSAEMRFVENQQRVISERLEALAERLKSDGRKETAKAVERWLGDSRFLLSELGEVE